MTSGSHSEEELGLEFSFFASEFRAKVPLPFPNAGLNTVRGLVLYTPQSTSRGHH